PHHALAVRRLAVLLELDLGLEPARELHEASRGAGMEPELVDDLERLAGPGATHPVFRSESRWATTISRFPRNSRASSSASATDRCRPPVQPTAMVRYDFPSRS